MGPGIWLLAGGAAALTAGIVLRQKGEAHPWRTIAIVAVLLCLLGYLDWRIGTPGILIERHPLASNLLLGTLIPTVAGLLAAYSPSGWPRGVRLALAVAGGMAVLPLVLAVTLWW